MRRVTGLGGVFFKSSDPEGMHDWYARHLGIKGEDGAPPMFHWRTDEDPGEKAQTIFSVFEAGSTYFDPSTAPFMLNFRVDDLDALVETLKAEGVSVDDRREASEFGKFAWITDPEGRRIELWQPPSEPPQ